ncbi:MAG: ParA family protein [Clostridia bacterium]
MSVINSYALWNHKGGVGKSTITFHLAIRYAEKNPDKNVIVIDLCPQANSSMMLLGGGEVGEEHVIKLCSETVPKSVVGYLSTTIMNGRGAKPPKYSDFIVKVEEYNNRLPSNIYLLCGDGNLELMAPAINETASAKALTPNAQPWSWTQEIIKRFIKSIDDESLSDWMVFIDTNPSFSIYTQIAISAVNRLLIPINADNSSKTAVSALVALLHGTEPPHPIYGSWTYAAMAKEQNIVIPKIHLLIGNRLTQFEGPARAYGAISEATSSNLYTVFNTHPEYFTGRNVMPHNKAEFINNYSSPLRDFNTAGVVCAHMGNKLSSMKQGYYTVYTAEVKVNSNKIKECIDAIDKIVGAL